MTDDDKPMLSSFTEFVHEKNLPQSAVDAALEWYFGQQATILEEQSTADKAASEATIEELRQEYGREYRGNMQLAKDFIAQIPGVGVDWAEARMRSMSRRRLTTRPYSPPRSLRRRTSRRWPLSISTRAGRDDRVHLGRLHWVLVGRTDLARRL